MSETAESDPGGGRLPDFFLIGAMKAGSTTLWGHLASHPDVFMCRPKEPQFWSRDAARARGLDWYRSLFAAARADQLCGEASTCYSRWPHFGDVAGRIAQHFPRARFVYILRHPVERAYSHYVHLMDERLLLGDGAVISFEKAIDEIPEIVDTSLYLTQIEQFLPHYPRSVFHVTILDDLQQDFEASWGALQDFLGVARVPLEPARARAVDNPSGDRVVRVGTRRTIERLERNPLLGSVSKLVPRPWRADLQARLERTVLARRLQERRVKQHRAGLSPLSPEIRARLAGRLRRPTRDLEEFLGRRLPGWFE